MRIELPSLLDMLTLQFCTGRQKTRQPNFRQSAARDHTCLLLIGLSVQSFDDVQLLARKLTLNFKILFILHDQGGTRYLKLKSGNESQNR